MSTVTAFPYIRERRRILERDALRIAAHIHGASFNRTVDQAALDLVKRGLTPEEIDRQMRELVNFLVARVDHYAGVSGLPSAVPAWVRERERAG